MKYIKLIYPAILSVTMISCNDWLDVYPDTVQREDVQFTTYKGFKDALTGCYMNLADENQYGKSLTMSNVESLASLWYIPSEPTSTDRLADYYLMKHDYKSDYAKNAVKSIYAGLFNTIAQANMIIKYADENKHVFRNEANKSVILGEAYAIRAYCQFDILRLFGQMPNGGSKTTELPYSETTQFDDMPYYYDYNAYVKKLESDLNKAESLLKDNDPVFAYTFSQLNYPSGKLLEDKFMYYRQSRINYWAIKALKARTYLYLGDKTKAYENAIAILDGKGADGNSIMNLSGHNDLVEKSYKGCPNECIWYLSKYNVKTTAKDLIGGSGVQANTAYLYTLKTRVDEMFAGQSTDSHNRYRYVWNKNVNTTNSNVGAAILKYYFADDAENQMLFHQIIPMLRMSEVYLIAIESTSDLSQANELFREYMLDRDVVLQDDSFTSLNRSEERRVGKEC